MWKMRRCPRYVRLTMSSSTPEELEAQISSDEAFARRLQAEQQRVDSSTPLIRSIWGGGRNSSGSMNSSNDPPEHAPIEGDSLNAGQLGVGGGVIQAGSLEAEVPAARRNVRMNVMDDGYRGMNASRFGLLLLMMVNIPLVVAGIVVLVLHWKDDTVCTASQRMKWRWWALLSVVRMALFTPVILVRWKLEGQREEERNQAVDQLSSHLRNSLDIVGLVWFVIGHLWLLQNDGCNNSNPSDSPIYQLCLVYIIITYIQICLPCILLMLLVPVICFCLPCVIRVLGMMQGQQRTKGARREEIDKLPVVKHSEMPNMEDESCAICLVEYASEDDLRKLPCGHAFHKGCVDSWLLVNASCPNCRQRCFDPEEDDGEEKSAEPTPMAGETLV